jgi:anti-anti-sigma factor
LCDNHPAAFAVASLLERLMPDQLSLIRLDLDVERHGELSVVHCTGRLVTGLNDLLQSEVRNLIPCSKRIVLDFTNVTHMDSTGLGTLVRAYVSAKSAGCTLELINIGKPIRQLLGITHLLSTLESVGEHNIRVG